jgi:hypothetical protein
MNSAPSVSQASVADPKSRMRGLLRFSLRTLFIVFTVGCIWLGIVTKGARDQRAAVGRVLQLGGSVVFDYEIDDSGRRVKDAQSPGWLWLRQQIGDEYFRRVVQVRLDRTSVSDDDLRKIGKLSDTKLLSLNWTPIGDSGMSHLRSLQQLEYLGLAETRITDEGLRYIERADRMESLILDCTSVSDEGLNSITKLKGLETVNLQSTRVTSQGVKKLSQLPQLKSLYASNTDVDDSVVESISSQKALGHLILTGTKVSGRGLLRLLDDLPSCRIDGEFADLSAVRFDKDPQIATLWAKTVQRLADLNKERRLKLIDLSGSQITERFLSDLYDLDRVEVIDLRDTKVSDSGVEALRQALPKCQVVR